MEHLGDITKISGLDAPPVDVVIGGSPCQDLSIAGKRAGLAGERSGLFMEQIRIIKELRDADARNGRPVQSIRPRFMVWENVPGALSSNKGEDFRAVLEETARVVQKDAIIPGYEGGGGQAGASWETDGASLGEYSTHSFGECPSDAVGSRLSQILEDMPPRKYSLSAKACAGILRRAERRGKTLPQELEQALIRQSQCDSEKDVRGG